MTGPTRPGGVLLLVGLLLAAPVSGGSGAAAIAERVEAQLEAWDVEGAQKVLDELLAKDPGGLVSEFFRGRVLFEQGRYKEAAAAFQEVSARGAGELDGLRGYLKLARAAAAEVSGHEAHESEHFVLSTRAGKDALLVPYALAGLEKAYSALTADLGFRPAAKIRVEVYESADALARVSPLTVAEIKASGTIALCKYNRLMITSPRALLRGYPWLDTLSHELVHFLVTKKGRNNAPIWLQEGLAKFLETRWRGPPGLAVDEMSLDLLLRAARSESLIPFRAMHPSIAKLPTQEKAALAFAEVEGAMRLLHQKGGQAALTELVAALARGSSEEDAVAQAYGKSFAEFEADWRAEVAKPRKEREGGKAPRPPLSHKLVFKEDVKGSQRAADPSAPRGSLEPAAAHPADPEARRAARLAEILFVRRRWGAAAHEYARARARLPREVPQLARRYAFAQIQLGRLAEARSALESATARDPQDEAAQVLLAQVLLKRGEPTGARAALEAGIAIDPFDPQLHAVYVELAREAKDPALEAQEKRALALAAFGEAEVRPPTNPKEGAR